MVVIDASPNAVLSDIPLLGVVVREIWFYERVAMRFRRKFHIDAATSITYTAEMRYDKAIKNSR